MKKVLVLMVIVALALIFVFLKSDGITGNVALEIQESSSVGSQLPGNLVLTIEQGDRIEKSTPILVSLTKGKKDVIEVKTLSIAEFIALSDSPIDPATKDSKEYFETPGSYSVKTSLLIGYTFTEKGNYELFFRIFDPDITIRKEISVK